VYEVGGNDVAKFDVSHRIQCNYANFEWYSLPQLEVLRMACDDRRMLDNEQHLKHT
jgi:hypothetical protein